MKITQKNLRKRKGLKSETANDWVISAEFVRKKDVEFILSKKSKLNKGVYADREYPTEIEKKRKILRPIFTAAKHSKKYKKRCRMENDLLVIKEKHYGINELEKLHFNVDRPWNYG